ncbi:MAG: Synechococcus phage, partial [Pseudomonadota bacterium]
YKDWIKRQQSLKYLFTQESNDLLSEKNLNEIFDCSKQHPIILKKFLSGKICIETMVIWDQIFLFGNKFDQKLLDLLLYLIYKHFHSNNTFLLYSFFLEYILMLLKLLNQDAN